MRSLAEASLSPDEHAVLEGFVRRIDADFGDRVQAVWLFGSRARGEETRPLSDVDVLVIADRGGFVHSAPYYDALHDTARQLQLDEIAWSFSIHVHDARWLQRRQDAGAPFLEEIERDRIELLPPRS
jgi:predicted nucleotidyltransferase